MIPLMNRTLLTVGLLAALSVIACEQRTPSEPPAANTRQPTTGQAPASSAATPTASDARALFDEAIAVLSTQPMGHERVDWAAVSAELRPTIPAAAPPDAAHAAISTAVQRLNDRHAQYLPPPRPTPPPTATTPTDDQADGSANASKTEAPNSKQPATAKPTFAGPVPTEPDGQMLAGQVAYIVLPICAPPDVDGLRQYAAQLRGEILELELKHPRAWIVEMRFNGGGNCWPMLIGLQPLLGDGVATTSAINGRTIARSGCFGTAAWMDRGDGPIEQLRIDPPPGDRLTAPTPIAVLIGSWTSSSGELATLAFIGRERTRLFGEATNGLTTVNNYFPLSDGSVLNLPVEQMGDRAGRAAVGPIKPDEVIESSEWPSADDPVTRRAIEWALTER